MTDFGSTTGGEPHAREMVYRYLRQRITTGEYGGGIRLVEEQIAEELGVSRTPIREALQRLASEGLVLRVRRGQLVVVEVDAGARAELHLLRCALDEVAARMLTERAGQVDWAPLYELLTPLETAIRENGIGSSHFSMAHLDLHMAINRAAFSPVTSSFVERQAFLYPTDDYVQQPGHEPVSQHRALLDDLSSGDLERATTAVRIHALRGSGTETPQPATGSTIPGPRSPFMSDTVTMFVNGQAMSGGELSDSLASARFLGPIRTAPEYRFFSFNDVFPGLVPVSQGGWPVPGEIYEIAYADLRDKLLPREPAELELSVIKLEDGRASLSMVCRELPTDRDNIHEITAAGGWRDHLAALSTGLS